MEWVNLVLNPNITSKQRKQMQNFTQSIVNKLNIASSGRLFLKPSEIIDLKHSTSIREIVNRISSPRQGDIDFFSVNLELSVLEAQQAISQANYRAIKMREKL